ncbi:hypothetical protein [Melioribacter sp. OK-6-Me]|uniref:hypothetical protein n=1 Tax=unclassified Melioribacter TaxID=2627329 RepID=UPI003ED8A072
MINFLRIIIWILIVSIIYRLIKTVYRVLTSDNAKENNSGGGKNSKYKINKEDVIEAKFEEIKPKENSNP